MYERYSRRWITDLAQRYEYNDDREPRKAGARAARRGHYSRQDFLTVVAWKTRRTLPLAKRNSARQVQQATHASFATDNEANRILHLTTLHGVGFPVASTILHFAFPDLYPILDYRALQSLSIGRRTYTSEFWVEYVDLCQWLARRARVSVRELDKALWQNSREET